MQILPITKSMELEIIEEEEEHPPEKLLQELPLVQWQEKF